MSRSSVEQGRVIQDEFAQVIVQGVKVGATGTQHPYRRCIFQQREEQVFDRHEFMPVFTRFLECVVQGLFQFFIKHCFYTSSFFHRT